MSVRRPVPPDLHSRWDRYLGMTAAMTQVPVPTAIPGGAEDIFRSPTKVIASNDKPALKKVEDTSRKAEDFMRKEENASRKVVGALRKEENPSRKEEGSLKKEEGSSKTEDYEVRCENTPTITNKDETILPPPSSLLETTTLVACQSPSTPQVARTAIRAETEC